jgi:outer membrane protein assembly factor BamB
MHLTRQPGCTTCSRKSPATFYSKNDEWWEAGKSFYGGGSRRPPNDSVSGKFLKAIDIQTGKTAWEIPDIGGGILASGLMSTAGGLIFYGDGNGALHRGGREEREVAVALQHRARVGRGVQ